MMYTQLEKYKLWYDGQISIPPKDVAEFMWEYNISPTNIKVTEIDSSITQYNKFVPIHEQLSIKEDCVVGDPQWTIPDSYKTLDIEDLIAGALNDELNSAAFTDDQIQKRIKRVEQEILLFSKNNLYNVLRTIYYIINTFTEQNVVWGVGRGSSVSSYILYLLKVHDVDSVEYELHIQDFIS